jgi:hypothetical protein
MWGQGITSLTHHSHITPTAVPLTTHSPEEFRLAKVKSAVQRLFNSRVKRALRLLAPAISSRGCHMPNSSLHFLFTSTNCIYYAHPRPLLFFDSLVHNFAGSISISPEFPLGRFYIRLKSISCMVHGLRAPAEVTNYSIQKFLFLFWDPAVWTSCAERVDEHDSHVCTRRCNDK